MRSFDSLGKKKVVIGMVHLLPLPGTPFYEEGNEVRALDKAIADAKAAGNNTVIELTNEEAAAFAEITLKVTDKVINDLNAADVVAAMQGK